MSSFHSVSVVFVLLILLSTEPVSPVSHEDHYSKSPSLSLRRRNNHRPQEYLEVTLPSLPSDQPTPSCSHLILSHSFGNTINSPPFSTPYYPPYRCPSPWSRVLLDLRVTCKGEQYDRIAALWLGGVELLRTSTAEPTKHGIFWNVQKDITRYSSLLLRSDLDLTMMLENIVNHEYTGIYSVTVTLLFYKQHAVVEAPIKPSCERRLRFLREESGGGISEMTTEKGDLGEVDRWRGSWDLEESPADLIPPLSHATFQVILKPQSQFPPTYPRSPSDRFLIKTAQFPTNSSVSVNSWFASLPNTSPTYNLKLKVAFVGPVLLRDAVVRGDLDAVRNFIKRQRTVLADLSPNEAESLLRVATELVNPYAMVHLLLEAGLRLEEEALISTFLKSQ